MITDYQTFEELTATATAYMTSQRYSLKMIDHYQRIWRYVGDYLKEKGIKDYTTLLKLELNILLTQRVIQHLKTYPKASGCVSG